MRHLSAIILVLFLGVFPSCKFLKDKGIFGKKSRSLVEMMAKQDSVRIADSIRKAQDHLLVLENAKIDSIKKADEEARLAAESKYNIIVGSFITPEYARALAAEYNKIGYSTQIIKLPDSKFELVAAESHNSFRKANERLLAFQDTILIESWMYIRK